MFSEDDENILKTRKDYLEQKASELETVGKQIGETVRNNTTHRDEGETIVNHMTYPQSDVIESVKEIVVDPRTDVKVEEAIFNPVRGNVWGRFIKDQPFSYAFYVEINNSNILIESVQIRNSDSETPFTFILSESDLQDSPSWEQQDMVHMPQRVKQDVYTYPEVGTIVRYQNRSAQKKLFCALNIYFNERPFLFEYYSDKKAMRDYFRRPITFTVTVRYLVSEP